MPREQTVFDRIFWQVKEEQDRKVWEGIKLMAHQLEAFRRMLAKVQHRLVLARSAGNRRRVLALEMARDTLLKIVAQPPDPRTSAPCSTPPSGDPSSSSASKA